MANDDSDDCESCGRSLDDEPGKNCETPEDHNEDEEEDRDYDNDFDYSDMKFADPGGNSSLRAASETNPRNLPCGSCGAENVLTPADVALGYQCNGCADAAEGFGP